jgi:hypothetical protein
MTEPQKGKVIKELCSIRNIGPAIAAKLYEVGVRSRDEVLNADPEQLYGKLSDQMGPGIDRCVLYVLRGAKADKPWPQCSDRKMCGRPHPKERR